jgi:hypothetical protein
MTPQPELMTALYAVDINELRNTSTEDLEKLVRWTWLLHQLASGELQSRDEYQDALPGRVQPRDPHHHPVSTTPEREPGRDS